MLSVIIKLNNPLRIVCRPISLFCLVHCIMIWWTVLH